MRQGELTGMRLADIFTRLIDEPAALGFRAYDGSSAGPEDAEAVLEVRSPDALAYLARSPGQLGLARAYVTGSLEIHGDLHRALHEVLANVRPVSWPERLSLLRGIGLRPLLRRPEVPREEATPGWRRGLRHSKARDAAAIAHHYDVSNRF